MFPTRNDIPKSNREKLIKLLNARLADAIDLQTQCKQAHWNVKGPSFIALHELFDKINEEVEDYVDLIAERAAQLGGEVRGTLRMAAKGSELREYGAESADGPEHVRALADSLAAFGKLARKAIDQCDELDDKVSADILTEIARGTDKWLWFIEAHGQAKR